MAVRIASILFVLTLGGCSVGDVTDGPGGVTPDGNNTAEASFNSTVKPAVATCVGCHAGTFPPNLSSYATLIDKYKAKPSTTNILVTKGAHQNAAWFTPAQQQAVAQWIDGL